MKKKVLLCAALCAMILAMGVGCSQQDTTSQTASETTSTVQSENSSSQEAKAPTTSSAADASNSKAVTATIYIGAEGNFKEYPCEFDATPTAKQLIAAIAEKTGWNLTLADVTTSGKGGTVVSFAKESALFTGPPEVQKEEFHMYDAVQLARNILDSIQQTLQKNMVNANSADPASLNIYYSMEGNQPLVLSNINITIPMEKAYSSSVWTQKTEEALG